jgi:cytochrome d ubiquinol oxidase subunit II
MNELAFIVVALMLSGYALLDGYDLGAGIVTPFIARNAAERGAAIATLGPYWNGNEVWLIAAGGVLFAAFPLAYASSFSGFYLPFMVVLWLLMFRGIALELRDQVADALWQQFFDATFSIASALVASLLGVAFGNVIRGVPLDATHYFAGTFTFLLNPYAVGVGILAVLTLALHGSSRLAVHLEGEPARRATAVTRSLWPVVAMGTVIITAATFAVHSPIANVLKMPWIALAPLAMLIGLCAIPVYVRRGDARGMFRASTVYIGGMLGSAAATVFPYLLTGFPDAMQGIRIDTAPVPSTQLALLLGIVIAGLLLVGAYRTFFARRMNLGNYRVDER